jgi:ketosteroid isomerase-like protein
MKRMMMLAGIICVVFIAACGGSESPSSVAKKFYAAVEKGDSKAIEQLATPETAQLLALFGEKAKGTLGEYGEIKSTTEKIDGDTAVVTLNFANGDSDDLNLVKVDGKWKVAISK